MSRAYRDKVALMIARTAWTLTTCVCFFTVENIWLDSWLRQKSHNRLPSFVPEPLGAAWVLVLASLGAAIILSVSCLAIIVRDKGFPVRKKVVTTIAVLLAMVVSGIWFSATGGASLVARSHPSRRHHTVTLRWTPSTTKNVRYNIYRGQFAGGHPDKLNTTPLDQPTYIDTTADNGSTYFYVVRAADSSGRESPDSNEVTVSIPK